MQSTSAVDVYAIHDAHLSGPDNPRAAEVGLPALPTQHQIPLSRILPSQRSTQRPSRSGSAPDLHSHEVRHVRQLSKSVAAHVHPAHRATADRAVHVLLRSAILRAFLLVGRWSRLIVLTEHAPAEAIVACAAPEHKTLAQALQLIRGLLALAPCPAQQLIRQLESSSQEEIVLAVRGSQRSRAVRCFADSRSDLGAQGPPPHACASLVLLLIALSAGSGRAGDQRRHRHLEGQRRGCLLPRQRVRPLATEYSGTDVAVAGLLWCAPACGRQMKSSGSWSSSSWPSGAPTRCGGRALIVPQIRGHRDRRRGHGLLQGRQRGGRVELGGQPPERAIRVPKQTRGDARSREHAQFISLLSEPNTISNKESEEC